MGYIRTGDSKFWVERTPSREQNGESFFEYFLVIDADEDHWIELEVDGRSDITHEMVQEIVDEWSDYEIEDIRVIEQKVIRAVG